MAFATPLAMKTQFSNKTGRLPLSSQIAEMLMRDVQSGVLPDGERLPPERTMAKELGIAIGTLRKALAELEQQGVLLRIQGSGNYINHPLDFVNVYALFRLERREGPGKPTAQLLSVDTVDKPPLTSLPTGHTMAHRFRRVRYLDDFAAALEEIWLDGHCAQSIDVALVSNSLYRFYTEHLGLRITRAEDRVSVATLPEWAPEVLSERNISHWGYIERVSQDQHGQIVEYSRTWFDPDDVRFVAR